MVRILHVDDNGDDQQLIEFNLRRLSRDIKVEWASSCEDALVKLTESGFDVVLCDYQMPGMSGLELLSEIRKRGDETPFIFLTGQGNEETAAQALRDGANDYFTKEAGFAHYDRLLNSVRLNIEARAHRAEHQASVRKIERLNRVLIAIRNINQLITKESNIDRVILRACELLIETRGYRSAWIATLGDGASFVKVAGAGVGMDFDQLRDRLLNGEKIDCIEKALSQSAVVFMESGNEECTGCLLANPNDRENTLVVRLEHEGLIHGVMGVTLDPVVPGDQEEQDLLAELASDIAFALHKDILVKARTAAEEALRQSEARVRMKLESILSPEVDIGALELADIIDTQPIQAMMDEFFKLTRTPFAIIDLRGNILVATGWQDICTQYHRVHPETHKYCLESDIELSGGVERGAFNIYKCKNGLWDVATPIIVGGKHLGNLFLGQFFFSDEIPDYEMFRAQARRYGFDENEYIAALDRVPRLSRDTVNSVMTFYTGFASMIADLSYGNIKLARALAERDGLLDSLRQSEALLNTTQRLTKIGGWEWDVQKQTMFWTEETYRIHDLAPGEIKPGLPEHIAKSLECYDPPDRPVILAAFQRCADEGRPYDMEFPFTTTKGRRLWIRTTAQPMKADNKVIRVVGSIMDITERKRAEEALRSSKRTLASLMSNLPGVVYRCRNDKQWTVEFISEGCKRLTGYLFADLVGNSRRSLADLIHPDDRQRIWDEVQPALDEERPFELTYRILTASGREKWVWEKGMGIYDSKGRLEALEGFITDISESKLAEEQLQLSRDQLAATNRELEAFAYSVSHDLQAPLRHIEGFSRLLLDDFSQKLEDEGREYLNRMMEAAGRMSLLINDLLKLSRSTRGELSRKKVDLGKIASEIAQRLTKEEPDRTVNINIHHDLKVHADPGMMQVVLENLIGNAWKFTARKRSAEIEIGSVEIDGRRAFFVRDNGAGFNASDSKKLFVPFQRLHSEKEFPGTGIGLATVQRIIHRHGGRVWAEGRKGKGATVFFTLS
jgi:PAS domain S-box-containing protein